MPSAAQAAAPSPAVTVEPTGLERDQRVFGALVRHGDHPSAFLTLNDATCHFEVPSVDGVIAYRATGRRHLTQICGPLADPGDKERLLDSFLARALSERRRVTAVQLRIEDVELYRARGFAVNQFGSSYAIDLAEYRLGGTFFMKTRNKLKRARRLGVTVEEVETGDGQNHDLDAIDNEWLRGKGRLASQLEVMVGQRGGRGAPHRRVFVARQDGRAVAYATYVPCFDAQHPGWLYDLTRRRPSAPPGAIELIFDTAAERLREEGSRWLHLGLTPFVALLPEAEPQGSQLVRWVIRLLSEHGQLVYPARTQEQFKLKWRPAVIEPEYIAFQGRPTVGALVALLRVTNVIPV